MGVPPQGWLGKYVPHLIPAVPQRDPRAEHAGRPASGRRVAPLTERRAGRTQDQPLPTQAAVRVALQVPVCLARRATTCPPWAMRPKGAFGRFVRTTPGQHCLTVPPRGAPRRQRRHRPSAPPRGEPGAAGAGRPDQRAGSAASRRDHDSRHPWAGEARVLVLTGATGPRARRRSRARSARSPSIR